MHKEKQQPKGDRKSVKYNVARDSYAVRSLGKEGRPRSRKPED